VTVKKDNLSRQPGDWLNRWAAELEAGGCVASGDGWKLAQLVVTSVPLDPRIAFRLLYGEGVDFEPGLRIQVDSPILRNDTKTETPSSSQVTSATGGLQVELRSSENLLGYERAWFEVKTKSKGVSATIVELNAERHVNGEMAVMPRPRKNYFVFPTDAGYYRLVYKQEQTEFTALVVAGRTRAERSENAAKLTMGAGNCKNIESGYCVSIPKGVAANLFLPVMVNGKEQVIHWGGTVREAIATQDPQSASLVPTLSISKPYAGKPTPIEFDRSSQGDSEFAADWRRSN
jgi:hypothetical protein